MKKYNLNKEKYKGKIRRGAIFVCNHNTMLDPFIVSDCFWYRRMFFLAAEAVMKNKIAAFFLKGIGCIKIDRNISDIEAIKKCVDLLKEGNVLSVFPQGSLQDSHDITAIKGGVILLAIKSGVPIIPMYIKRKSTFTFRQNVVIGDAFYCSDYCTKKFPSMSDIDNLSQKLLEKMAECKEVFEELNKENDK